MCSRDWKYIFISKLIGEFNLTGTAGRYGSGNYFFHYTSIPKSKDNKLLGKQQKEHQT